MCILLMFVKFCLVWVVVIIGSVMVVLVRVLEILCRFIDVSVFVENFGCEFVDEWCGDFFVYIEFYWCELFVYCYCMIGLLYDVEDFV